MILRGLALLARGRKAGLAEFEDSNDALLASLAPLIAFPLVGAARTALLGQPEAAILGFLARLAAVLAVPVITYECARIAGRQALWRRTATALDWSFWVVLPVLAIAAIIGALLEEAGLGMGDATMAAMAVIVAYVLWLQYFILRAGLQLGVLWAIAFTALNSIAVGGLTAGPVILAMILPGTS